MSALDFDDDEELARLRQLYETLQGRILSLLDELERLRASGDYELYKLSRERPEFVQEVADWQAEAIATEIAELEAEAEQLAEEIEGLTGAEDPFRE
jgi:DNA polymerase-3 subunit epsilon